MDRFIFSRGLSEGLGGSGGLEAPGVCLLRGFCSGVFRKKDMARLSLRGCIDPVSRRSEVVTTTAIVLVIHGGHLSGGSTIERGSIASPSLRISKWRCGAVERPVFPLSAITSCCSTASSAATKSSDACAYIDSYPSR